MYCISVGLSNARLTVRPVKGREAKAKGAVEVRFLQFMRGVLEVGG